VTFVDGLDSGRVVVSGLFSCSDVYGEVLFIAEEDPISPLYPVPDVVGEFSQPTCAINTTAGIVTTTIRPKNR